MRNVFINFKCRLVLEYALCFVAEWGPMSINCTSYNDENFLFQYKLTDNIPKLRTFRSELRMLNNDDDVIDGHVTDVTPTQYTSHTASTHFVTSSHDVTSSMASRESLERRTQHVIEQARQTMTKVTPIRTEVTSMTSSIRNIPTTPTKKTNH